MLTRTADNGRIWTATLSFNTSDKETFRPPEERSWTTSSVNTASEHCLPNNIGVSRQLSHSYFHECNIIYRSSTWAFFAMCGFPELIHICRYVRKRRVRALITLLRNLKHPFYPYVLEVGSEPSFAREGGSISNAPELQKAAIFILIISKILFTRIRVAKNAFDHLSICVNIVLELSDVWLRNVISEVFCKFCIGRCTHWKCFDWGTNGR